MKYLLTIFCLTFISSCQMTPEQWEEFNKSMDELNEGLAKANDSLNAGNPNYKRNTPSTSSDSTQPMTTRYFYESEYLKGTQKVCVYSGSYGNKTQYRVLDNQYKICPKAIEVPL